MLRGNRKLILNEGKEKTEKGERERYKRGKDLMVARAKEEEGTEMGRGKAKD